MLGIGIIRVKPNLKLKLFISIFISFCTTLGAQEWYKAETMPVDNTAVVIQQINYLNDINSFAGQVSHCTCSTEKEDLLSASSRDVWELIYRVLFPEQARGFGITLDAHASILGAHTSIEFLKFGNALTLFQEGKGMKVAAYCAGGVGGSVFNAAASVGANKIQTFGRCDSPDDYVGGFINVGVEADIGIGVGAGVSLGFDMGTFSQKLSVDFPYENKEKRKKLKNQILRLILMSQTDIGAKEMVMAKAITSLFEPDESAPLKGGEVDALMASMKSKGGAIFKTLTEELIRYIEQKGSLPCLLPKSCDKSRPTELLAMLEMIKSSFGHCHAFSAGASIGTPPAGSPVSITVGYSDYVKIADLELDTAKLAKSVYQFTAAELSDLWDLLKNSCLGQAQYLANAKARQEVLKKALRQSVDASFNKDVLEFACEKALIKAGKDAAQVTKLLVF